MDTGIGTSKSRTLYLLLRDRIASGVLAEGARLPSEPALVLEHAISRVTVRRALDALERDGLIRRQPGAGTFVTGDGKTKPIAADFANLLAHIVEMGRQTAVRLLSFGYEIAPPDIAEALKLSPGERIQRSIRVRLIDGQPFSYLVTSVPERIGVTWSESELAAKPLLSLLERSGVQTQRASQSISAVLAGPEAAEALDVDVGSALLGIRRTVFDRSDRGVEHLQALYRPDRYVFQMEMTRTGQQGNRRWSPVDRGPSSRTPQQPARPARRHSHTAGH
jgi:GntR family transcriptional regulator